MSLNIKLIYCVVKLFIAQLNEKAVKDIWKIHTFSYEKGKMVINGMFHIIILVPIKSTTIHSKRLIDT